MNKKSYTEEYFKMKLEHKKKVKKFWKNVGIVIPKCLITILVCAAFAIYPVCLGALLERCVFDAGGICSIVLSSVMTLVTLFPMVYIVMFEIDDEDKK